MDFEERVTGDGTDLRLKEGREYAAAGEECQRNGAADRFRNRDGSVRRPDGRACFEIQARN